MKTSFASVVHLALLSSATAGYAWEDPDGLTCAFRPESHVSVGDDGEEVCISLGEALCRDSGAFGKWKFGVHEDTGVQVLDPNGLAVYKDFPGASDICINEKYYDSMLGLDFDASPPKQPYLYIYDDCNDDILAELSCEGAYNINVLSKLKMPDNSDVIKDGYVRYPVDIVKFKKGSTPDPIDNNALWAIEVDIDENTKQLEGKVTFNEGFCVWDDYYSSARCDALDCNSTECCDVDADNNYIFPQCENTDFCNNINNTVVVDEVEQTWDDICKDLGITGTGEKISTLTGGQKGRLEESLKNYFDAVVTCEEGGESGDECVDQEQRRSRKGRRQLSEHDADPTLDTLYVTITSYDQFIDCNDDTRQLVSRELRKQKSKGKFNRARRARNRKRRRRNNRRRLNIESFQARRLAQNLQCPPNLVDFLLENNFTSVEESFEEATSPKDCNNPTSDACQGTGDETSAPCCGIVPGCKCNFVSVGQCEALGCSSSSLCCELDICEGSESCEFPTSEPTSAPTATPTSSQEPSATPSSAPSASPSYEPSTAPSASPSAAPTASPTTSSSPSASPTTSSSPSARVTLKPVPPKCVFTPKSKIKTDCTGSYDSEPEECIKSGEAICRGDWMFGIDNNGLKLWYNQGWYDYLNVELDIPQNIPDFTHGATELCIGNTEEGAYLYVNYKFGTAKLVCKDLSKTDLCPQVKLIEEAEDISPYTYEETIIRFRKNNPAFLEITNEGNVNWGIECEWV